MDGERPRDSRIAAVLAYRDDGLGTRLMTMGNGIRLADMFNCRFEYMWTANPDIADIPHPSELFDTPAMAALGVNFTTVSDAFARPPDPRLIFAAGTHRVFDISVVPPGSTLFMTCVVTMLLKDERAIVARAGLSKALRKIVPKAEIADRASAFIGRHDLASAIGVHVRRGDITDPAYAKRHIRLVELDQYFTMLDVNRTRDEEIFLCTEDQSVIDAFEARYPNRVLRFPTRTWDRSDKRSVEDALIEIMALSHTSFVIAGPSSFSRAATGLGYKPLLLNAPIGGNNFIQAAVEFTRFGMLDRAAANLAACQSEPESELLIATRARLDRALAARDAKMRGRKPAPGAP